MNLTKKLLIKYFSILIVDLDALTCYPIKAAWRINLYAAMGGYDAGIANPYDSNGDPAMRNRIFLHWCPGGFYNFISAVRRDMHCDSDFSLKSVTSEAGYNRERSSSNEYSEEGSGNSWLLKKISGKASMAIILNPIIIENIV